jgi:hypothetical protein
MYNEDVLPPTREDFLPSSVIAYIRAPATQPYNVDRYPAHLA